MFRPYPGGLRNCDYSLKRCIARAATGRHSSRCTWSNPARASRIRRRGKSRGVPPLRPVRFTSIEPGTTITRTFGLTLRPFKTGGSAAQIGNTRIGATADKDDIHGVARQGLPGFETHVDEGLCERVALQRIGNTGQFGNGFVIETPMPGLVPKVIIGSSVIASMEIS